VLLIVHSDTLLQAHFLDPTRPVAANMFNEYGPGTLSDFLDVQGLSHGDAREYASARAKQPKKPLIASECCSCLTQRDENDAILNTKYSSFNADCLQAEVGLTDALPVLCLLLLLWKLTLCAMRYLTTLFGCSHFMLHRLPPPLTTTAYHHRLPPPLTTTAYHHRLPPPLTTTAYHHRLPPPPFHHLSRSSDLLCMHSYCPSST
jgi:hypothetical protein